MGQHLRSLRQVFYVIGLFYQHICLLVCLHMLWCWDYTCFLFYVLTVITLK